MINDIYYKRILSSVSDVVISCAETLFGKEIKDYDIFKEKKPSLNISVARGISLVILHDMYGMSYSKISLLTGMKDKSVMKRVSLTRSFIGTDKTYTELYSLVKNTL